MLYLFVCMYVFANRRRSHKKKRGGAPKTRQHWWKRKRRSNKIIIEKAVAEAPNGASRGEAICVCVLVVSDRREEARDFDVASQRHDDPPTDWRQSYEQIAKNLDTDRRNVKCTTNIHNRQSVNTLAHTRTKYTRALLLFCELNFIFAESVWRIGDVNDNSVCRRRHRRFVYDNGDAAWIQHEFSVDDKDDS